MTRTGSRIKGGTLAFIGFLLSPLSWWNDWFVNVPLALGFAWAICLFWPDGFTACFVVGYWLTNVIGLVLLRRGGAQVMTGERSPFSRRGLLRDLGVALAYTLLIAWLVSLRILQPLQSYLPTRH